MSNYFPKTGDLSGWADFLSSSPPPMLAYTRHRLAALRLKGEAIVPSEIAAIGLSDPLFSAKVISDIQSTRNKHRAMDITTIEHALMMQGIDPFYQRIEGAALLDEQITPGGLAHLAILALAKRGYVASRLARQWAEKSLDMHPEELQVAALIHDIAEILLWLKAPGHALLIKKVMDESPSMRSTAAQQRILGFTLTALTAEIAHRWGLPDILSRLFSGEDLSPRIRTVSLAVRVARHSSQSWANPALPDDWSAVASKRWLGFASASEAKVATVPFVDGLCSRWDGYNSAARESLPKSLALKSTVSRGLSPDPRVDAQAPARHA